MVKLHPSWLKVLSVQFSQDYFISLTNFVRQEYQTGKVFPPPKFIFNALDSTPFDQVKVVILGQDPYHDDNQANGLAFSVNQGVVLPPSLKNIFKEIVSDVGSSQIIDGDLSPWAKQGVLLLNATLTVKAHQAGSHQNHGWETFTDAVIKAVSDGKTGVVFILWGNYARRKKDLINSQKHLILESTHPSPLSAYNGFFGCKHFSETNTYLMLNGEQPIKW